MPLAADRCCLDQLISKPRFNLGIPELVETVPGAGYLLDPDLVGQPTA
jgi:hypothetical protein